MQVAQSLSLFFAAGALGGLVNSLLVWFCGQAGIPNALGVSHFAPELTPAWLYPRIVWGGLWGFLFALPLGGSSWLRRGLLLSLAPTAFQCLVVFRRAGLGAFGLELGALTPAFVVFYNAAWGATAAWWLRGTRG